MRESLRRRIENLEQRGPNPTAIREAMRRRRETGEIPTDPILRSLVLSLEATLEAMRATVPGPPLASDDSEPQSLRSE